MEKNNITNIANNNSTSNTNIQSSKLNPIEVNKNYNHSLNSRSNLFRSIENVGYKSANKIHRFATLGLFLFTFGNITLLLYKYNSYWKNRRVSLKLLNYNISLESCLRIQVEICYFIVKLISNY